MLSTFLKLVIFSSYYYISYLQVVVESGYDFILSIKVAQK